MSALPELPIPSPKVLHVQLPDHYWYGQVKGYSAEQMRNYGDARAAHARQQALAECVSELRGMKANNKTSQSAINQCAEALEELK